MIKAVIFDVDGVLLDSFEANLEFFQNLMRHTGYPPPTRESFSKQFHFSMWDAIKAMTGLEDDEKVKRVFEKGESADFPYSTDSIVMPEGAGEVIEILSGLYALGIVTSRLKANIFETPELAALKSCFKADVGFEDTEKHKPDPEPLILATRYLGVKPEECVYVGDLATDVEAAHAAGMNAIVYSKEAIESADAQTADFKKIPELIKSL